MTDVSTSEGGASTRRAGRRASRGWPEILAALTVLFAVVGMAVSSPPLVGPDEAAHQATATYTTVHIWPPTQEFDEYTPGILKQGACMAFKPEQDASCMASRDDVSPGKVRVLNYPPPYYWVVGLGQKLAPGADDWSDVGGRAASLLLNLAGLVLLALLARRTCRTWGTYVLLITTPMAAFLWAVVNPNGWEITAGILFAFLFGTAWWNRDPGLTQRWAAWSGPLLVLAAGIAFALSRHDALVWIGLLGLAVVAMGRSPLTRGQQGRLLGAAAIGVLAGVAWQLTHPAVHNLNNPDRVTDPTLGDQLHWLAQIDEVLPDRLRQMVGVLGWLDTPTPQWLVFALLFGWAALIGFLYARTRISPLVLVIGFVGTIIAPSLLEVLRWNDWPYWYQGRITLAFTLPFLFVFLVRYGNRGPRAAVGLSLLNAVVLAVMVWQNLMRYSFGITDYIPLRWSEPAIGGIWFWLGVVSVAAIVVATGLRAWHFYATRTPRRP